MPNRLVGALVATLVGLGAAGVVGFQAGCASLQSALSDLEKPGARIRAARLSDLSLDSVDLLFDVDVSNPYDVPLPITTLDYDISSGGKTILKGSGAAQGSVPAKGSKIVTVPARVTFRDVLGVLEGVTPGSVVPYKANVSLGLDAPGAGPVSLPLGREGELPVPAVPEVSLANVTWDTLSLSKAAGELEVRVRNTNRFNVDLSKLSYALSLGGTKVAEGRAAEPASFKPGGEQTIRVPVSLSPRDLGVAAFNMLKGGTTSYSLSGDLDLGTPFGPLRAPFSRTGQTTLHGP